MPIKLLHESEGHIITVRPIRPCITATLRAILPVVQCGLRPGASSKARRAQWQQLQCAWLADQRLPARTCTQCVWARGL